MKTVTREEWIAALRSGEYKQAKGRLKDGDRGFCCLGVACDLAGYDWPKTHLTTSYFPASVSYLYASLNLDDMMTCCLAWANDRGHTFAEIADALEGDTDAILARWDEEFRQKEGLA